MLTVWRGRFASRAGQRRRRARGSGMTLIETGLVVALFGVLAIYLTESHLAEWHAWDQGRKVDGTVTDVWGIIDAARAWAGQNAELWPNDGATPTASIQLTQLVEDGYLRTFPESRDYAECNQCGEYYGGGIRPSCCYAMTGWDYSTSAETTDPEDADDLIIRFSVWGKYAADTIAAQIPSGKVSVVSGEEYRVEAQAPMKGGVQCIRAPSSPYVRVCGEDRAVKMSRGDLQGVNQITEELQDDGELQGAALALQPAELSVGAFGTMSEPQVEVLLRRGFGRCGQYLGGPRAGQRQRRPSPDETRRNCFLRGAVFFPQRVRECRRLRPHRSGCGVPVRPAEIRTEHVPSSVLGDVSGPAFHHAPPPRPPGPALRP